MNNEKEQQIENEKKIEKKRNPQREILAIICFIASLASLIVEYLMIRGGGGDVGLGVSGAMVAMAILPYLGGSIVLFIISLVLGSVMV